MKVIPGMNPQSNSIEYIIESRLLEKYSNNFIGLVKDRFHVLPSGTKVELCDKNSAKIIFPLPDDTKCSMVDEQKAAVVLKKSDVDAISSVIEDFRHLALQHELMKTEFIPLNGYPLKDLQSDVVNAVKNKRSLCILKTYQEYLEMDKSKYEFNQVYLDYGTEEYVDAILMIYSGELDKLKEIWEPKLEFTSWD